jgi:3-deoxy-D-manno-octulosonic-acid transferase
MIWLYRFLFPPLMLLASPYYLRRMLRRGGYGPGFSQRFGATPALPSRREGVRRIWIQAVSVGEMLAIGPLVDALLARGDIELYLTTTTSTGHKLAQERYGSRVVGLGYFPIDSWPFSARAWRKVQPDLVILTEGERWPEHIRQASSRGIPVVCVNARMSDRGYARMQRFRGAVLSLFGGITRWLPCSRQDAERLMELGFPGGRITPTGNIKLDVTIAPLSDEERSRLRAELGFPASGLILLGSSTWPGEEEAMLAAYRAARAAGMEVSLLLVPRHAERRAEVRTLLEASGLPFHFRSTGAAPGPVCIAVGDTTGELRKLTQLADLVFVGKSLPPHHEGQTPIEAAALGKPILFGPRLSNFREISRDLLACGGALPVADAAELADEVARLLAEPARRATMAQAALAWHRTNQGSVARTVAAIRSELRLG